jgi:excisionase family DNA binding protein
MAEKLLTVEQYAFLMGVKPLTVRRWIKNGEVKVIRKGRTVRISEEELKTKEE